jgi:precorrin-3B C17-methyltransferase
VVVSSGDPGVFAMASAVLEALEKGPERWRYLEIRIEPGVTAMLAAAAHAGAPLGGDFCAISLSDNLKSWATIERRLTAAATGDFVIALYNPASKARPHQLDTAFALLRSVKVATTPVLFIRAAGTTDVRMTVTTLADARADQADMRTLVLIGASTTRLIDRPDQPPLVYTPRAESQVP